MQIEGLDNERGIGARKEDAGDGKVIDKELNKLMRRIGFEIDQTNDKVER